jgi:ketosteroid isomerase-like protein
MRALADAKYVAAVHNYFDAIRGRDENRWLACFSPDAVCHDPVGSTPAEGRARLRQIWHVLTAPFKALSIVEREVFYGGSGAAVYWSAHGTGVNDGSVDFTGITILEFAADGTIQTAMSYWDPAAMLIELAGEDPETSDDDPSLRN